MPTVRKIPKEQDIAPKVRYKRLDGSEYLITSDIYRKIFVLWKIVREGYEKIDTADNPKTLYATIEKRQKEREETKERKIKT